MQEWKNQGPGWLQYREAVRRAAEICKENSTQMIGLILPLNLDPSLRRNSFDESVTYGEVLEAVGPLYRALEAEFQEVGVPLFSFMAIWASQGETMGGLDERGKGHFGPKKNERIAAELLKAVAHHEYN